MTERTNRQLLLARRPVGDVADSDFELRVEPVPPIEEGQLLIRNLWLSFDPTQRGWLNPVESYVPPVAIGEVMRASGVGQVVESRHPGFVPGEFVSGLFGWQDWVVSNGMTAMGPVQKIPAGIDPKAVLGVFGVTGVTAYFGMIDLGQPTPGCTVLVSGAAGATGSVAGQVAKIKGAGRVIGIAGGADKCAWLVDRGGFDAAIDYKSEDVEARIRAEAPNGVDVFFDNVGGPILEAALNNLAMRARVVLCGGISSYNAVELPPGPRNYMQLVIMRARMEGFIVIDYLDRWAEAVGALAGWVHDGLIHYEEDIQVGLEHAPATLRRLFEGRNLGKQLLKITDPPIV
jgi:NADPH-dependent curcumin reductase CurA